MPTLFEGQTPADVDVVRALVDGQCPRWRDLPLTSMETSGTEHSTYRLGAGLLVRLPRDASAEQGLHKEIEWLPRLRGHLGLELPVVEHVGSPGPGFPHAWTVNRWVAGEDASSRVLAGDVPLSWAEDLATLVARLRAVDLGAVPAALLPRGARGGHLRDRVRGLEHQSDVLAGPFDPSPVRELVEQALTTGDPTGEPVLLHADLIPGNLVVSQGHLTGLLDLGTLTTGCAAWDLTPAWWVLDRVGRDRFRSVLDVDDVSWAWGRALAAVQGALAAWVYTPRHHPLAPLGARALTEARSG